LDVVLSAAAAAAAEWHDTLRLRSRSSLFHLLTDWSMYFIQLKELGPQLIPESNQMEGQVDLPQWHLSIERQLREQQARILKLTSLVDENQDQLQRLQSVAVMVDEHEDQLQRLQSVAVMVDEHQDQLQRLAPLPQQVQGLEDDIKDLKKKMKENSEKLEILKVKVNSGTCTSPLN
jgi:predicted RNase H-like nuclease (RuvC/YqgF family)